MKSIACLATFIAAATASNHTALRFLREDDGVVNRRCHETTPGYIDQLVPGKYADSTFFNCFRTQEQIFEFMDKLMSQQPAKVTKLAVSKTFEGRVIYAYKVKSAKASDGKAIYFQSMQHAREWAAGSSNVFGFASTLDAMLANQPNPTDLYDVYFVPIINIDGYIRTWNGQRYRRHSANNVDLNRNWPSPYWNKDNSRPGSETYPGPSVLSEPETSGLDAWLKSQSKSLDAVMDIHTNAALVLWPYGDSHDALPGDYKSRYEVLAKDVMAALNGAGGAKYDQRQWISSYGSYGTFRDYGFRTLNKASICMEVQGADFIVPASTIRQRGKELYAALKTFSTASRVYNSNQTPTVAPTPTKTIVAPTTTKTPPVTATPTTTRVSTTTRAPVTTKSPPSTSKPTPSASTKSPPSTIAPTDAPSTPAPTDDDDDDDCDDDDDDSTPVPTPAPTGDDDDDDCDDDDDDDTTPVPTTTSSPKTPAPTANDDDDCDDDDDDDLPTSTPTTTAPDDDDDGCDDDDNNDDGEN